MKLDSNNIKRFKAVDLSNFHDMNDVLSADDETGECTIRVQGEEKSTKLEPGTFRIVRRR